MNCKYCLGHPLRRIASEGWWSLYCDSCWTYFVDPTWRKK